MPSRRETYKPVIAEIAGQLLECAECGAQVRYDTGDFKRHLREFHSMSVPDYYLTYLLPGADYCMCGCGEKVEWTPKTGGRFPDFIRGHQLNYDNSIKERVTTHLGEPRQPAPVPLPIEPGSALPDAMGEPNGFLHIKSGVYHPTKNPIPQAYRSGQELRVMLALDTGEITCDWWSKCELVVPLQRKNKDFRGKLEFVFTRDKKSYYVSYVPAYWYLTQAHKDVCEAVSMISGSPAAIISYQTNQKHWFIVWSTVDFSLWSQ